MIFFSKLKENNELIKLLNYIMIGKRLMISPYEEKHILKII